MNQPTETPVFSKTEGEHVLQVWPHPYRGSAEIRSRHKNPFLPVESYLLSGPEEVLTFARDVVTTAGLEEETFIVSRAISYPVERALGKHRICGVGNNMVVVGDDSSPELLETMASNLAAIAADIREGRKLEEIQQEELKLRERQDGIVRALFGEGREYTALGLKARTAVEAAIEAQDELAGSAG